MNVPTGVEPSDVQRWVLAVGAPLMKRNGRRLDRLGGEGRPTVSWEAASVLRNGWSVHLPRDAERVVNWLLDGGGHRAGYEAAGKGSAASFAGWDASRASNVAGWAYAAYLIDLETAWRWHLAAAALAQKSFGSWAELGQSYLRGLSEWSGGARDILDPSESAVGWLSRDPSSPWITLPFGIDLSAPPPPAPPVHEVVVGEGEARSIADAVRLCGVDGRVVVPAGTYEESLVLPHSVEIVARGGEVTLKSAGKPCVFVEGTRGVVLRGLTLRSGTTETGQSLNAVRVLRGYARIEDCDIAASHDGVQLAGWGSAHVIGGTIHDCGSHGLNQIGGQLIAERTQIRATAKDAIKLGGEAPAFIEGCTITGAVGAGVMLLEKVTARIQDTEVKGCGGSASIVAVGSTRLLLDRVSIRDGRGGGVFFQETASGVISTSEISGCALAALDVGSSVPVIADRLLIANNLSSGVVVRGGATLCVFDGQLDHSAQGHVWVMAKGRAAFAGGSVLGGALAFWAQGGAELYIHAVSIEKQAGPAIDAQPGSKVKVSLARIAGATGDGVVVGDGADVALALVQIDGVNGAGVRVASGGHVRLEGVTFGPAPRADDVVGPAVRADLADSEASRRTLDAAFEVVRRGLLG